MARSISSCIRSSCRNGSESLVTNDGSSLPVALKLFCAAGTLLACELCTDQTPTLRPSVTPTIRVTIPTIVVFLLIVSIAPHVPQFSGLNRNGFPLRPRFFGFRKRDLQNPVFERGLGFVRINFGRERNGAFKRAELPLGVIVITLFFLMLLAFFAFDRERAVGKRHFEIFFVYPGQLRRDAEFLVTLANVDLGHEAPQLAIEEIHPA